MSIGKDPLNGEVRDYVLWLLGEKWTNCVQILVQELGLCRSKTPIRLDQKLEASSRSQSCFAHSLPETVSFRLSRGRLLLSSCYH